MKNNQFENQSFAVFKNAVIHYMYITVYKFHNCVTIKNVILKYLHILIILFKTLQPKKNITSKLNLLLMNRYFVHDGAQYKIIKHEKLKTWPGLKKTLIVCIIDTFETLEVYAYWIFYFNTYADENVKISNERPSYLLLLRVYLRKYDRTRSTLENNSVIIDN